MLMKKGYSTEVTNSIKIMTERVGVAVTLWARTAEMLGSNLAHDFGYLDPGFCSFPQSLEVNPGTAPLLGHDDLLPNPFQLLVQLSHISMIYRLGTDRTLKESHVYTF
jgi:hypothetical protein